MKLPYGVADLVRPEGGRASDAGRGDRFGSAVAIDDATAVVGAPYDDDTGAAYVYDFEHDVHYNGYWTAGEKVVAPVAGSSGDLFGTSVAVDGETWATGAPNTDVTGYNSGTVYVSH